MDIINDIINTENQSNKLSFDAVWQRVMPELEDIAAVRSVRPSPNMTAETHIDDAEQLRAFMDSALKGYKYYNVLAARRGGGSAVLKQLAADKKAHLRRLETAYFILTGNSYTPGFRAVEIGSVLTVLRERYMAEMESSEKYAKAARTTENPRLAALYTELSKDAERHAAQIEGLIEMIME